MAKFEELLGKTLTNIDVVKGEEIIFTTSEGTKYKMHHWQECCEYVRIKDICGDLEDLIGSPILMAEEVVGEVQKMTWTFYKLATIKGYVTIEWLGESNGWYSERVDFERMYVEEDEESTTSR